MKKVLFLMACCLSLFAAKNDKTRVLLAVRDNYMSDYRIDVLQVEFGLVDADSVKVANTSTYAKSGVWKYGTTYMLEEGKKYHFGWTSQKVDIPQKQLEVKETPVKNSVIIFAKPGQRDTWLHVVGSDITGDIGIECTDVHGNCLPQETK